MRCRRKMFSPLAVALILALPTAALGVDPVAEADALIDACAEEALVSGIVASCVR